MNPHALLRAADFESAASAISPPRRCAGIYGVGPGASNGTTAGCSASEGSCGQGSAWIVTITFGITRSRSRDVLDDAVGVAERAGRVQLDVHLHEAVRAAAARHEVVIAADFRMGVRRTSRISATSSCAQARVHEARDPGDADLPREAQDRGGDHDGDHRIRERPVEERVAHEGRDDAEVREVVRRVVRGVGLEGGGVAVAAGLLEEPGEEDRDEDRDDRDRDSEAGLPQLVDEARRRGTG